MKTLITFRRTYGKGGVANFFEILKPHFSNNIEFFIFQKKTNESIFGNLKHLLKDYFKFKRTINNYDIIHINPSLLPKAIIRDGILIKISKKQGKKVIVFFHGWDETFENKIIKNWLYLFKKYYFNADAIIVLANKFKKSLLNMGYNGKLYVESTAVEDDIFPSNINPYAEGEKNLINILFLSRVTKEKGIYEAIDTVNQLRIKGIKTILTVAGDGPELGLVKKYVKTKAISGIYFKGHVSGEDKIEAFKSSDIYLFPSYSEGMPISLLEAMAYGIPVITRSVGGIKDFFENEKMGYLTDSFSPIEFAKLIEKLIYNPELRKQIGKYNHDYANKRFKASNVAERLESIYGEILEI